MEYVSDTRDLTCDPAFPGEVKRISGVNFHRCYQCSTCALGCPLSIDYDILPNQLIRMVQLGLREPVLKNNALWLCTNCDACHARCPHGVDLPRVMDTLRQMALQEDIEGTQTTIPLYHRTFLDGVKRWRGRQHELSLLLSLKLRTGFSPGDGTLGRKMFRRGKLRLLPPNIAVLPLLLVPNAVLQRANPRLGKRISQMKTFSEKFEKAKSTRI